MAEIVKALKALKLYGMAQGWAELASAGTVNLQLCEGLIRTLLQAETTDRGVRSIRYQMNVAKFRFPDLARP